MRVELVLSRVGEEPVQGTAAVFNGGRSARDASQAIVDVYDCPAHLQVRREPDISAFLGAFHPASAVDYENDRGRLGYVTRQVEVGLERHVVCRGVGDVGRYG